NRNIEDFAAVHGLHVEITLHPSAPSAHDGRIVVQGGDRTNGINVCRGDLVHVRKSRTTDLEFDDLFHGQDSQSIKNLRQVHASGSADRQLLIDCAPYRRPALVSGALAPPEPRLNLAPWDCAVVAPELTRMDPAPDRTAAIYSAELLQD